MTAMPAGGLSTGSGETSRRIASAISNSALPTRKADCPSAASGSALPWPKRCSRSAGTAACRTAKKVTSEAAASTSESTRLDSSATEPVPIQATNFAAISTARDRERGIGRAQPQPHAWPRRRRGHCSRKQAFLAPCLALADERPPGHAAGTAAPARTRHAPAAPGSPTSSAGRGTRGWSAILPRRTRRSAASSSSRLAERPRLVGGPGADLAVARPASRNRRRPRRRRPARPCPRCGPAGPATSSESTAPRAGWRRSSSALRLSRLV